MATLNGARALGLADQVGSIESGKWADLATIDLTRLNSQPVYDPISQIVYAIHSNQVRDVWVAGRHQVENGELLQAARPTYCEEVTNGGIESTTN